MSKLTDALKDIGVGVGVGVAIGAGVWVVKKLTESENKEAAFNQNLKEEDIYDVKNETDINILREKHRMKMEAERERERKAHKAGLNLLAMCGVLMLVGMVGWLAEHIFLLIGLIAAVFICVITWIILRHKRLMRQHNIDILKTNVSTIGESEAERLAKKYQE